VFSVKREMNMKMNVGSPIMCSKLRAVLAALIAAVLPATVAAAWQVVATDQGKRVELDRASIVAEANGVATARGRVVLDKPIVDPKTSASYRIIEVSNRFNCAERTLATLKRSYFKEEGELLRQEEVKSPFDMPVRSGTPDDNLFREACRPKGKGDAVAAASKTAEKVNEAAGELRRMNAALVEKELRKEQSRSPVHAASAAARAAGAPPAPRSAARAPLDWSYAGPGGPQNWSKLSAAYAACDNGRRQSPIDIRDGIAVDLEPIEFAYQPANFRVLDDGHTLQVSLAGGSISVLGKNYRLREFHFHQPSEERVNGKSFDMVVHLRHEADDGKLAVVAVLLEKGGENPLLQTVWNNLPLEKDDAVAPPTLTLDAGQLLPQSRAYYTYMGSLTTPPCSEGVLWLVLKQPQQVSAEQLAIFARLYKNNARPLQPSFDRVIKESR
jgi:carbonic anhydrase